MKYYIKQIGENDCGFTCVKMLLAIYYKNSDYLFYPIPHIESQTSLKEIIDYAHKADLTLIASRVNNKNEIFNFKTKKAFLAPIKRDNQLHMVLIKRVYKKRLLVFDPAIGVRFITKNDFIDIWNGEIIEVKEIGNSCFKAKKNALLPKSNMIITIFFQISSFICLMLATLFIDKNFNFLIPLSLFFGYIIFEILYQKAIIYSLKYFDNYILLNDFTYKRYDFRKYFEPMNRFKYSVISSPIQLINNCLILIFGLFVLGINNLINLAIVATTFIFQILFFFYEKYHYSYRLEKLELLEKKLLKYTNKDVDEFKNTVYEINNETYRYVSYFNFKRYFLIFLTLISCLVYQGFIGEISINFMLFHFFIYIYLQENFEKLLNFNKTLLDIKYYKCLYLYYFH